MARPFTRWRAVGGRPGFGGGRGSRVEEEVQLDRAPHPIQETTTNLAPPLIIATLADAVSFLALLLAEVPMIRSFGVLLAIGIVVVLVADLVLPTAILGAREYYRPTPSRAILNPAATLDTR